MKNELENITSENEKIQKKCNDQNKNIKEQYEITLKNYQKEKSRLNSIINNQRIEITSLYKLINEKNRHITKKDNGITGEEEKILIGKIIRN